MAINTDTPQDDNFVGSFYFKQTVNGNLIGEYANNNDKFISTESATNNNHSNACNFIGLYDSTWFDTEMHHANLKIDRRENTNNKIFILRWTDVGGQPNYEGEGFQVGDKLIGYYRKVLVPPRETNLAVT
mgnify:CR=1 FL=1